MTKETNPLSSMEYKLAFEELKEVPIIKFANIFSLIISNKVPWKSLSLLLNNECSSNTLIVL
jgi:hypothetical protein